MVWVDGLNTILTNPRRRAKFQFSSCARPPQCYFCMLIAIHCAHVQISSAQSQLGGLVGQSSGYMESLPAAVRKRIRALKKLQVSLGDELIDKQQAEFSLSPLGKAQSH